MRGEVEYIMDGFMIVQLARVTAGAQNLNKSLNFRKSIPQGPFLKSVFLPWFFSKHPFCISKNKSFFLRFKMLLGTLYFSFPVQKWNFFSLMKWHFICLHQCINNVSLPQLMSPLPPPPVDLGVSVSPTWTPVFDF